MSNTTQPATDSPGLPAWIYFGLLLLIASAFILHDNSADRDLWHRLALGRYVFTEHALPQRDVFSYLSEPVPLHDHEWGSGILFYALYQSGGGTALVILKLVMYVATLMLVDRTGRIYEKRRTLLSLSWIALIALALVPSFASTVRCLVFTNFFFALWLFWLARQRAGHHVPTYYFVITAAIWANLHGGFIAGLGLIALYAIGERINRRPCAHYLPLLAFATLATLVNPSTYHLWISTLHAVIAPRDLIYEWAPLPLANSAYLGVKIVAVITLLTGLALLITRRSLWDWVALVAVGVTLVLALQHLRHLALFAIVAGVFTYRGLLALFGPRLPFSSRLKNGLTAAILTAVAILALFLLQRSDRLQFRVSTSDYPVHAVNYIREHLAAGTARPLLVPFNWGSYALWQLYPHYLVSLDGRYELIYSQKTYHAVSDFFFNGPNPDRIVLSHPPEIVLTPRGPEIEKRLTETLGFIPVYADDVAAVYFHYQK